MPFRVCYYHVIWTTKNRERLITPEIELIIFAAITQKSTQIDSPVLAINGVADHIHVVTSISTSLAVAEWVRNVKGISAHQVNAMFPDLNCHFRWQQGYGVLTFGAKMLPLVIDYVAQQKAHHQQNTLEPYLEREED
ncbi:MAG: IS200/IS605 family transposase [Chloroflexi bacterium]|nr:IS200/IS605 family transposase [Chloroflexota bacterium]